MTYHTYPLDTLLSTPLGILATTLRTAIDPASSTLIHDTRSLATRISRGIESDDNLFGHRLDLSRDVLVSSWAKYACFDLDFGLGTLGVGGVEAVRRPRFTPVESVMYLLPKTPEGEIVVAVCLCQIDMDRSREDEEFGNYAGYIG